MLFEPAVVREQPCGSNRPAGGCRRDHHGGKKVSARQGLAEALVGLEWQTVRGDGQFYQRRIAKREANPCQEKSSCSDSAAAFITMKS
jgi:hypothetical protein